jgi:hypothetical protein
MSMYKTSAVTIYIKNVSDVMNCRMAGIKYSLHKRSVTFPRMQMDSVFCILQMKSEQRIL